MADFRNPLLQHAANLVAPLEPYAAVGTGIMGAGYGGLLGLLNLAAGRGGEKAAQSVRDVQQALTYQPRTEAGSAMTGALGGAMQRAGEFIEEEIPVLSGPVRGDWTLGLSGSPLLATIAESVSPADVVPASKVAPAIFLGAKAAQRALDLGDPSVLKAFGVAEALEKAGKTPEEIWEATGMHFERAEAPYTGVTRSTEGDLQFELPDPSLEESGFNINAPTLSQAVDNPELFDLVPGLRGFGFERLPDESSAFGAFSSRGAIPTVKVREAGRTPMEQYSTMLHEVQHAVDKAEGLDYGSSMDLYRVPDIAQERLNQIVPALEKAAERGVEIPEGVQQDIMLLNHMANLNERGLFDLYRSSPGETRARTTQARMEGQLRGAPEPDVPIEIQIEAGQFPTFNEVWTALMQDLQKLNTEENLGL